MYFMYVWRGVNKFWDPVCVCITWTQQDIWCSYWSCSFFSESSPSAPGTKTCLTIYQSIHGIIDLIRFLCPHFPTRSNVCFCSYTQGLLFFSKFQAISDAARWCCRKGDIQEPPRWGLGHRRLQKNHEFVLCVFFPVLPSPHDPGVRFYSSVVFFLQVPPICFPHAWTKIFKCGIPPATYRFSLFLKNVYFFQTWCPQPRWFRVYRRNSWELGAVFGIWYWRPAGVATPWIGIGSKRGLARDNRKLVVPLILSESGKHVNAQSGGEMAEN